MKNLIIVFNLIACINLSAQDTLNLMFYNLLNYPYNSCVSRWDTLKHIIDYTKPDVLMVCELRTEAGVGSILDSSLNVNGRNNYKAATFVSQQSSSGSSNLQQMLFYNGDKLALLNEGCIITETRDINEYLLLLKNSSDSIVFDVLVTHLKSSQGSQEEALRAKAVDSLFKYLANKPTDYNYIFSGDFNLYSSSEAAYQKLIDTGNHIIFKDPVNTPGDWHNNVAFQAVHTQSSRYYQECNDGAGSGLDDRFDFIMVSENIMNGSNKVYYLSNTYKAIGNNGNSYGNGITYDKNGPHEVPDSILSALYYMSDHLPVFMTVIAGDNVKEIPDAVLTNKESNLLILNYSVTENILQLSMNPELSNRNERFVIYDIIGKEVMKGRSPLQDDTLYINIEALIPGKYFLFLKKLNTGVGFDFY